MNGCKYCTGGQANKYGVIRNSEFPAESLSCISHDRPYIFQTNGMSFLAFENFSGIKINYCLFCAKDLRLVKEEENACND